MNFRFDDIAGGFGGDRNGGGAGGDYMVTQEDTIFVCGMDTSVTEEDICEHFGAIGLIKVNCYCQCCFKLKLGFFCTLHYNYKKIFCHSTERQAHWKAKNMDVQGQGHWKVERRGDCHL